MKKLSELGISPAPWFIDENCEIGCHYISHTIRPNERRMRIVAKPNHYFDAYKADVRLVAAAPKMYAKAWELITAFDNRVMSPKHIEALRAALAEAAGEEVAE